MKKKCCIIVSALVFDAVAVGSIIVCKKRRGY